MVKIVLYIFICVSVSFNPNGYAQETQIDSSKQELSKLKDEISKLETELAGKIVKKKNHLKI